jgi:hypothetical protein
MDHATQNEDRWVCNIQTLPIKPKLFDVVRFVMVERVRLVRL